MLSDFPATNIKRKWGSNPIHKYTVGLEGESRAYVYSVLIEHGTLTRLVALLLWIQRMDGQNLANSFDPLMEAECKKPHLSHF